MRAAAESVGKVENVNDATPSASSALQSEAELAFQRLKVETRECHFDQATSLIELVNLPEL